MCCFYHNVAHIGTAVHPICVNVKTKVFDVTLVFESFRDGMCKQA